MNVSHIVLAAPQWLWLGVPLVMLGVWRAAGAAHINDRLQAESANHFVHPLAGRLPLADLTARRLHAPRLSSSVQWLALACLILALAQPQRVGQPLPQAPASRDIVLVVDSSISMALRDYLVDGKPVTRMTLLKGILGRFVAGLPGDRLSVVVYGDHPFVLVPPTKDHALVTRMLARIRIGIAGRTNAIGEAVALAVKQARSDPSRRKIIILFSGGARPTGDIGPQQAAKLVAENGMHLYTIAIGATGKYDNTNTPMQLLYDPADRQRLRRMAERADGRFYWAGDTDTLAHAIADISRLETKPPTNRVRYITEPLYQWPLLLAMLLLTGSRMLRIGRG